MGYACCADPTYQNSCGGFFCSEDQHVPDILEESDLEGLGEEEQQELLEQYGLTEPPIFDEDGFYYHVEHGPIESKELKAWLKYVLKGTTWEEWRTEHPYMVEQYQVMFDDMKSKQSPVLSTA